MSARNDGGPAFPSPAHMSQNNATGETISHESMASGVTVRDYFAAKAMATLSALEYAGALYKQAGEIGEASDAVAKAAYEIADAMLREREVKP